MKVEFINPFLLAGTEMLTQFIGGEVESGQLSMRTKMFTTQQISIMVGVSGQVRGQVIYGMSKVTATKIASAMIGSPHVMFDEMAASAIGELGNIISANAIFRLSEAGFICDLTPPSVIQGTNVEIATSTPALLVQVYTTCGPIEVNVALAEHVDAH